MIGARAHAVGQSAAPPTNADADAVRLTAAARRPPDFGARPSGVRCAPSRRAEPPFHDDDDDDDDDDNNNNKIDEIEAVNLNGLKVRLKLLQRLLFKDLVLIFSFFLHQDITDVLG